MSLGLIEVLLFFGVVMALAIWELWSVRPSQDPGQEPEPEEDEAGPPGA